MDNNKIFGCLQILASWKLLLLACLLTLLIWGTHLLTLN